MLPPSSPRWWRQYGPLKRSWTSTSLHDAIFRLIAVLTSNPFNIYIHEWTADRISMRNSHRSQVAENVADELARSDGREVRLEEERELQLPFLLPEDGYSCDVVRGVPQGLAEFLAPLQHAGLCRMSTQPTSSGLWTIYMTHEPNLGVSLHMCPLLRTGDQVSNPYK